MGNCAGNNQKSFFVVKDDEGYQIFCTRYESKAENYIQHQFWILQSNKHKHSGEKKFDLYEYIADGEEGYEFTTLKKSYKYDPDKNYEAYV